MTDTPLAAWINQHFDAAGGDAHAALLTMEQELKQQAAEHERGALAGAAPAAESRNPAHARVHTIVTHAAEKPGNTGENGTALDCESRGGAA